jgi:ABC-type transport system substrate-binding protein
VLVSDGIVGGRPMVQTRKRKFMVALSVAAFLGSLLLATLANASTAAATGPTAAATLSGSCRTATSTYTWSGFPGTVTAEVGFVNTSTKQSYVQSFSGQSGSSGTETVRHDLGKGTGTWYAFGSLFSAQGHAIVNSESESNNSITC